VIDRKDLSPELYATRYGQDKGLLILILRALERASWRTANHVFCIRRSHRRIILERGGVPATSTTIVGNGPLLAKTKPRPQGSVKVAVRTECPSMLVPELAFRPGSTPPCGAGSCRGVSDRWDESRL
jgi:hypothetical protein